MGLSGSGKSTLVRLLNSLIKPTTGNVYVDDINISYLSDKNLNDIRRKKISMVFQSFALMPHMNVIDNVSFGSMISGVDKKTRYKEANIALEKVGLNSHLGSYPDELSGGMQQRVGLARALCNDPDILLMDEAFSALDPIIRTQMQDELLALQEKDNRTIVFISHDLDEAIRIGDRIAIMHDGEISQIGTPEEIITSPANDYVSAFFQGADLCSIITAEHIAKKVHPTIINKKGFGINSSLKYINGYDEDFAYVLEKNGTYLGIVTVDSLKKQQKNKGEGAVKDAIIHNKNINKDKQISDFISDIIDLRYPVAVVDDNNKYKGSISRGKLLKIFDEGLKNE
jgi:glycine betaine/proline transport system ATP-binding protein